MKIGRIVLAVKRQIRHKEFGGQRELSVFLKPDPGYRRAAHAPMCVR